MRCNTVVVVKTPYRIPGRVKTTVSRKVRMGQVRLEVDKFNKGLGPTTYLSEPSYTYHNETRSDTSVTLLCSPSTPILINCTEVLCNY